MNLCSVGAAFFTGAAAVAGGAAKTSPAEANRSAKPLDKTIVNFRNSLDMTLRSVKKRFRLRTRRPTTLRVYAAALRPAIGNAAPTRRGTAHRSPRRGKIFVSRLRW